jgi:hypothetical protein
VRLKRNYPIPFVYRYILYYIYTVYFQRKKPIMNFIHPTEPQQRYGKYPMIERSDVNILILPRLNTCFVCLILKKSFVFYKYKFCVRGRRLRASKILQINFKSILSTLKKNFDNESFTCV